MLRDQSSAPDLPQYERPCAGREPLYVERWVVNLGPGGADEIVGASGGTRRRADRNRREGCHGVEPLVSLYDAGLLVLPAELGVGEAGRCKRSSHEAWLIHGAWIESIDYNPCIIARALHQELVASATHAPVVTIIGPRQSGRPPCAGRASRTRRTSRSKPLDTRDYARTDPRGFLNEHRAGVIFDEFQHVPELASYLQVAIDEDPTPGRFVLTGSQNLAIAGTVSQTLAGRTVVVHLLPPSYAELQRFPAPPGDLFETLVTGAYPRIHDRRIPHRRWLTDYVATYVQRDVRQVTGVADLGAFTTFLRLAASRTATEVNLRHSGAMPA